MMLDDYKVEIPEGQSGEWGVLRFEALPDPIKSLRYAQEGRNYIPGTYTRLYYRSETNVIMTDTPDEITDHMEAIRKARGKVLINGLGLGIVLKAILAKPEVTHIDVVEIEKDVINLVSPHYPDPRVTIHYADAFSIQWPKGSHWDVVWHDIWPSLCSDNLVEMGHLKRKYAKRCDWQGCWGQAYCQRLKRQRL